MLNSNSSSGHSSAIGEEDLYFPHGRNSHALLHEQLLFIQRTIMFGVTPVISVLGVIGNTFSIVILLKHGLHKCSNILLISLAFTDIGFLLAFNSVPNILYEVVGIQDAWECSKEICYALFIMYLIAITIDYGMCSISLTLPMLITIERLIAVFLPLKFNLIVTPKRTWSAVVFLYIFWYSIYIYSAFWFSFSYSCNAEYNISVGIVERSALYHDNFEAVRAVEDLIDYMLLKIPPVFTLAGCILIAVKVKMVSAERKKMTSASSKEASTHRTTKMLLAVCVVYMVTCAVQSLPAYLPQIVSWELTSDAPSSMGRVVYQVSSAVICINSSVNFVVYVALNKNFRSTYRSLFSGCLGSKKAKLQADTNDRDDQW